MKHIGTWDEGERDKAGVGEKVRWDFITELINAWLGPERYRGPIPFKVDKYAPLHVSHGCPGFSWA